MGYVLIGGGTGGGGADVSKVTATANDVLLGKQIVNSSGALITGVIPDNEDYEYADDISYTNGTTPYYSFNSIPEGYYHRTTGTTDNPQVRLEASKVQSFLNIPSANIKSDGTYQGVGTATVNDVLRGKTFSNASGSGLNGNIEVKQGVTATIQPGGSYTLPSGYYSGNSVISAGTDESTAGGTAGAAQILKDYTAYVNKQLVTGTMVNRSGTSSAYGEYSATASWDDTNKRIRMKIPANAYYNGYNYLYSAASNFGNATATQVLADRTFTSTAGLLQKGTMVNRTGTSTAYGEYSATLSWDDTNKRLRLKIPANAYYNGYNYLYTAGSNLGDATAGWVLADKTFSSSAGIKIQGTIENRSGTSDAYGEYSATASWDATNKRIRMRIPKTAYYNTLNYLYSAASNFGDVGAGSVLEGKYFTSTAGIKIQGTMPSQTAHNSTSNYVAGTFKSGATGYVFATPGSAGYYNTSTYIRVPVANLSAGNIKKGVTVGGIKGTFEGQATTPLNLITASNSDSYVTCYNGFQYAQSSSVIYRANFNNAYDSMKFNNTKSYTGFTLDMDASGGLTNDPYCICRLNPTAFSLNGYSTITVTLTSSYRKSANITVEKPRFGVSTNGALTSSTMAAYVDVTLGVNQAVYTIDVSNLTGSYYFYIWLKITRSDTAYSSKEGFNSLDIYNLKVTA